MTPLTTTAQVQDLIQKLLSDPSGFVTVDTEFVRETTYHSRLCLIQVAGLEHEALIDPLSPDLDLDVLKEFMFAPNILKVLHSARQDLEIFYTLWGKVPAPLFDTQIAAQVCGFGDSVGYESLVNQYLNETLDKSSRLTDWSRRPLTDRQKSYALSDVTHLRRIYEKMIKQLDDKGRRDWVKQDMEALGNPELYFTDPDKAWKRVKARVTDVRILARIREMAKVRELYAQGNNVARKRALHDESIVDIAVQRPQDLAELKGLRRLKERGIKAEMAVLMLKALDVADKLPLSECPSLPKKPHRHGNPSVAELLKFFLRVRSEEAEVAPSVIASAKSLEEFASRGVPEDHPLLHGWRHEIFGREALLLKKGEISLKVEQGKVVLI
ncbi:MAG: ribonuclease D [bacterium]|nr:ribonuclease D [bacterium]